MFQKCLVLIIFFHRPLPLPRKSIIKGKQLRINLYSHKINFEFLPVKMKKTTNYEKESLHSTPLFPITFGLENRFLEEGNKIRNDKTKTYLIYNTLTLRHEYFQRDVQVQVSTPPPPQTDFSRKLISRELKKFQSFGQNFAKLQIWKNFENLQNWNLAAIILMVIYEMSENLPFLS